MDALLYPLKKIWISADYDDHGYKALDLGWWDYDPSCPEDSGRNPRLYAMADGIVTQIVNSHPDEPDWEGYGNYITIAYPSLGYCSLYAHIKQNSFMVKVGDRISQLQPVARMGNSGYSYGNHLHLEVCKGTTFVRHGGVDFLPIVYATDWHIVDSDTQEEYGIRHMVIQPTDRDVTKMQLEVLCDDLNIRTEPSTDSKSMGFAQKGWYDVTELAGNDEGIRWAKVDRYWLAILDGDSELYDATFYPVEPNPNADQAEVTIDDLRIRKEPSTSSTIMGYCPEGYYDIEETHSDDPEYVWFKVNGYYIAFTDGVIYHPAQSDPKDKEIEELKKEVERLKDELRLSEKIIEDRENEIAIYHTAMDGIYAIIEPFYKSPDAL